MNPSSGHQSSAPPNPIPQPHHHHHARPCRDPKPISLSSQSSRASKAAPPCSAMQPQSPATDAAAPLGAQISRTHRPMAAPSSSVSRRCFHPSRAVGFLRRPPPVSP
ncbi:hypothetical protein M0R45_015136 [Rubus argutus]|uniref:Uncharacterized protein n=1 Tax=Rubus argutus TaxID=59490 RepID=A0AAW1XNS7_RUBAR